MKPQQLTTQDRFTLALHATWSVLRDPVLTKIYMPNGSVICLALASPSCQATNSKPSTAISSASCTRNSKSPPLHPTPYTTYDKNHITLSAR